MRCYAYRRASEKTGGIWTKNSIPGSITTSQRSAKTPMPCSTRSLTSQRVQCTARYLRKDIDSLEKRASRWLKDLARESQAEEFDLDEWIPVGARDSRGARCRD